MNKDLIEIIHFNQDIYKNKDFIYQNSRGDNNETYELKNLIINYKDSIPANEKDYVLDVENSLDVIPEMKTGLKYPFGTTENGRFERNNQNTKTEEDFKNYCLNGFSDYIDNQKSVIQTRLEKKLTPIQQSFSERNIQFFQFYQLIGTVPKEDYYYETAEITQSVKINSITVNVLIKNLNPISEVYACELHISPSMDMSKFARKVYPIPLERYTKEEFIFKLDNVFEDSPNIPSTINFKILLYVDKIIGTSSGIASIGYNNGALLSNTLYTHFFYNSKFESQRFTLTNFGQVSNINLPFKLLQNFINNNPNSKVSGIEIEMISQQGAVITKKISKQFITSYNNTDYAYFGIDSLSQYKMIYTIAHSDVNALTSAQTLLLYQTKSLRANVSSKTPELFFDYNYATGYSIATGSYIPFQAAITTKIINNVSGTITFVFPPEELVGTFSVINTVDNTMVDFFNSSPNKKYYLSLNGKYVIQTIFKSTLPTNYNTIILNDYIDIRNFYKFETSVLETPEYNVLFNTNDFVNIKLLDVLNTIPLTGYELNMIITKINNTQESLVITENQTVKFEKKDKPTFKIICNSNENNLDRIDMCLLSSYSEIYGKDELDFINLENKFRENVNCFNKEFTNIRYNPNNITNINKIPPGTIERTYVAFNKPLSIIYNTSFSSFYNNLFFFAHDAVGSNGVYAAVIKRLIFKYVNKKLPDVKTIEWLSNDLATFSNYRVMKRAFFNQIDASYKDKDLLIYIFIEFNNARDSNLSNLIQVGFSKDLDTYVDCKSNTENLCLCPYAEFNTGSIKTTFQDVSVRSTLNIRTTDTQGLKISEYGLFKFDKTRSPAERSYLQISAKDYTDSSDKFELEEKLSYVYPFYYNNIFLKYRLYEPLSFYNYTKQDVYEKIYSGFNKTNDLWEFSDYTVNNTTSPLKFAIEVSGVGNVDNISASVCIYLYNSFNVLRKEYRFGNNGSYGLEVNVGDKFFFIKLKSKSIKFTRKVLNTATVSIPQFLIDKKDITALLTYINSNQNLVNISLKENLYVEFTAINKSLVLQYTIKLGKGLVNLFYLDYTNTFPFDKSLVSFIPYNFNNFDTFGVFIRLVNLESMCNINSDVIAFIPFENSSKYVRFVDINFNRLISSLKGFKFYITDEFNNNANIINNIYVSFDIYRYRYKTLINNKPVIESEYDN